MIEKLKILIKITQRFVFYKSHHDKRKMSMDENYENILNILTQILML